MFKHIINEVNPEIDSLIEQLFFTTKVYLTCDVIQFLSRNKAYDGFSMNLDPLF